MEWFATRHVKFLESETERLRKDLADRDAMYTRLITEIKSAHVEELKRVIDENQILRDENERFRLALSPATQPSKDQSTEKETGSSTQPTEEAQSLEQIFASGTPWQRIQAREFSKQLATEAARRVRASQPAQAKLEQSNALRREGEPEERSQ